MLYQGSLLKTFSLSLSLIFDTTSPLPMNFQVVSFQRGEIRSHVQSCKFVCLVYIVTHVPPLQEVVIFCTLLYSTVVQHEVLANEDLMELEAQRENRDQRKKKKPKNQRDS